MTPEDTHYLWKKGALTIPDTSFRNALLRAYVEFVHPYMPLIELHEFLDIVDRGDGTKSDGTPGKISLVLFQAVMFTGTAFVDKSWLEGAGYGSRKSARKAFYLKARVRANPHISKRCENKRETLRWHASLREASQMGKFLLETLIFPVCSNEVTRAPRNTDYGTGHTRRIIFLYFPIDTLDVIKMVVTFD